MFRAPRVGQGLALIEGKKRKKPDTAAEDATKDPDTAAEDAAKDPDTAAEDTAFALAMELGPSGDALHTKLKSSKSNIGSLATLNEKLLRLIMRHSFPRGKEGMILPKFFRQGIGIFSGVCLEFFKLVTHTVADDMRLFIKLRIPDILGYFRVFSTKCSAKLPCIQTDYPPPRVCKAFTIFYLTNFDAEHFAQLLPFYALADIERLKCSFADTETLKSSWNHLGYLTFIETVYIAWMLKELTTNTGRVSPPLGSQRNLMDLCHSFGWGMSSLQTFGESAKNHFRDRRHGSFICSEVIDTSVNVLHHHSFSEVVRKERWQSLRSSQPELTNWFLLMSSYELTMSSHIGFC